MKKILVSLLIVVFSQAGGWASVFALDLIAGEIQVPLSYPVLFVLKSPEPLLGSTGNCTDSNATNSSGTVTDANYYYWEIEHPDNAVCFNGDGAYSVYFATSTSAISHAIATGDDSLLLLAPINVFASEFVPTLSGQTRISGIVEPLNNDITSSTLVSFEFDIFNNCTQDYDKTGIKLTDITSGYEFVPMTFDINTCGYQNFATTTSLSSAHSYLWQPYIFSSVGSSTPLYGSSQLFSVVSEPEFIGSLDPTLNATSTAFATFLNIPALLQTRIPFAYFYGVADLLDTLNASSSSFPVLSLSVGSSTDTFHLQWEALSEDTIQLYATPTNVALMRSLVGYALWLSLFAMIFFDLRTIHK